MPDAPATNTITGELYRIGGVSPRVTLKMWANVYLNIDSRHRDIVNIPMEWIGKQVTAYYVIPHSTMRARLVKLELKEEAHA